MKSATIYIPLDLCTRYPLRLDGLRQSGIQNLPDTFTHGQHWESNPRPFDLESNALSTEPDAPDNRNWILKFSWKKKEKNPGNEEDLETLEDTNNKFKFMHFYTQVFIVMTGGLPSKLKVNMTGGLVEV